MSEGVFFDKWIVDTAIATPEEIMKARRYGTPIVVENTEGRMLGYRWKGIVYIVDISFGEKQ